MLSKRSEVWVHTTQFTLYEVIEGTKPIRHFSSFFCVPGVLSLFFLTESYMQRVRGNLVTQLLSHYHYQSMPDSSLIWYLIPPPLLLIFVLLFSNRSLLDCLFTCQPIEINDVFFLHILKVYIKVLPYILFPKMNTTLLHCCVVFLSVYPPFSVCSFPWWCKHLDCL